MVLIGLAEIIEIYVFILIFHVHDAMATIYHVLLAPTGILELLRAEQANLPDVDPLGHVCQEPFKINEAIDVQDRKGVFNSHMVNILLNTVALLITE